MEIKDNTLIVLRGDTLEVPVYLTTAEGAAFVPAAGDVIRFTLKKSSRDAEPVIVKPISKDTMTLRLEASETEQLTCQNKPYVFTVKLITTGGNVHTLLCGALYVIEEGRL